MRATFLSRIQELISEGIVLLGIEETARKDDLQKYIEMDSRNLHTSLTKLPFLNWFTNHIYCQLLKLHD
jgi:hypothetical protein